MTMPSASRRLFLRQSSALALAGTAAPFALNLASIGAAAAATPADYKALVCVFLHGANDAHNTVVPYDASGYATYASVRSALAWTQGELTPLAPTTPLPGGRQVALPSQLAPLATLFDAGQCAIVANVGPLVVPTDRTSFNAKAVPLPPKLFSHNDQQSVWQASVPEGAKFGWGGRIGDLLASQNSAQIFTCNSLTGSAVFLSGQTVQPFQIDPTQGSVAFNALNANSLYGSASGASALRAALTRSHTHLFESDLRNVNQRSIDSNSALAAALAAAPALTTAFPANNALATQLAMVAKIVSVSAELGAKRQVFMVSLGGFDTHSDQDTTHPALLTQLAGAIDAFQQAMVELNAAQKVTLFTASDFGRTLTVNGDGTDHGWGGHHFVVGGAVNGKQVVGSYPDLAANGPTDAGNGRLIPTTAVEQYAATLARWMGVSSADLPLILPNIVNFPTSDLGFMT
jgi:uncharacterized protein (DUF1501 family)